MRIVSRKKGGFLDPVQKVPEFKYTNSEERIAWTTAIYPYAPYLFNVFREIDWDSYVFTGFNNMYIMKCGSIPYEIMGGSVCEIYNKIYNDVDLHKYVDPTGDIDCAILSPIITAQPGKKIYTPYCFVVKDEVRYSPHGDHFTRWLMTQVAEYFNKLSYNFETWFPTATETFDLEKGDESIYADIIFRVGPFAIYRLAYLDSDELIIKIQVSLGINYIDEENKPQTVYDHIIEFLFVDPPKNQNEDEQIIQTPPIKTPLGLYVSFFNQELLSNIYAFQDRYFLKGKKYEYKYYNHYYRSIYILKLIHTLIEKNILMFSNIDYFTIGDTYLKSVRFLLEKNNEDDTNDAILLLTTFIDSFYLTPEYISDSLHYKLIYETLDKLNKLPEGMLEPQEEHVGQKRTRNNRNNNINSVNSNINNNNKPNMKRAKTRRRKNK
jgi:hypothetical protein